MRERTRFAVYAIRDDDAPLSSPDLRSYVISRHYYALAAQWAAWRYRRRNPRARTWVRFEHVWQVVAPQARSM